MGEFSHIYRSLTFIVLRRLLVVSTKVGGVPEVLPAHMINFAKPEEDGKSELSSPFRPFVLSGWSK